MARPVKEGLEYFSLDVDIFEDHKILLAQMLIDPDGTNLSARLLVPYIAIRLLREIYNNGYYMEWNNLQSLVLSSKIGCGFTMNLMDNFTNCLIQSGFFNKEIYDKYNILTSRGIQKRWFYVVKNNKRNKNAINSEFRLYTYEKELSRSETEFPRSEIPLESAGAGFPPEIFVLMPTTSVSLSSNNSIVNNSSLNSNKKEDNNNINNKKEEKEKTEFPRSETEFPRSETEFPRSETEFPRSETEFPRSETEFPRSETEFPRSETEFPRSETEFPRSETGLTKTDLQLLQNTGEDFKVIWLEWENYRLHEHGKKYKSLVSKRAAIEELTKLSKYNEDMAIKIIKQSMSQGWIGFFELKINDNQRVANGNGIKNEHKSARGPEPDKDAAPEEWENWYYGAKN